ncbi:MAG: cardiolipin synthase ClsB, partial [Inhella sp.]
VVQDAPFAAALQAEFESALQGAEEIHASAPPPGWRGWRGWLRRVAVAWLAQLYLRAAGGGEPY